MTAPAAHFYNLDYPMPRKKNCVVTWPYQGFAGPKVFVERYPDVFGTRIICDAGPEAPRAPQGAANHRKVYARYWREGGRFDFDLIVTTYGFLNKHLPLISGKKVIFEKDTNRSEPIVLKQQYKKTDMSARNGMGVSWFHEASSTNDTALLFPSKELPEDYEVPPITHEDCTNIEMYWAPPCA